MLTRTRLIAGGAMSWMRAHLALTGIIAAAAAAGVAFAQLIRARRADRARMAERLPDAGPHRFGTAVQVADGASGATGARTPGMGA